MMAPEKTNETYGWIYEEATTRDYKAQMHNVGRNAALLRLEPNGQTDFQRNARKILMTQHVRMMERAVVTMQSEIEETKRQLQGELDSLGPSKLAGDKVKERTRYQINKEVSRLADLSTELSIMPASWTTQWTRAEDIPPQHLVYKDLPEDAQMDFWRARWPHVKRVFLRLGEEAIDVPATLDKKGGKMDIFFGEMYLTYCHAMYYCVIRFRQDDRLGARRCRYTNVLGAVCEISQ